MQGVCKKIKVHRVMGCMTWTFFVSVYILEEQERFEREFRIKQHNLSPTACQMSEPLLSYADSLCKLFQVIFANPRGIFTSFFTYESDGEFLAADQEDSASSLLHYQSRKFLTALFCRHIPSHTKLSLMGQVAVRLAR